MHLPPADLQEALLALANGRDAAGIELLGARLCSGLSRIAEDAGYRPAEAVVAAGGRRVWQSFQVGICIPRELRLLAGHIGGF